MADGFFLGGMAEGISGARKLALAERTQEDDVGLRTRALDIQEKTAANSAAQQVLTRFETQINDTMGIVSETVKNAIAGGRDPETIRKAVTPLVESAKSLAAKIGRNPAALDAQMNALLVQPTTVELKKQEGTGKAVAAIAEEKTLGAAGVEGLGGFKDKKQKVDVENTLRDDYIKQSKDFITIRDAKNRIDRIETTGAGDIALLFQYMKILDPGSTVREGEFATARNAAGVPEAVLAQYNRLVGGGQLSGTARKQIVSQANRFYDAQARQHDQTIVQFRNIAKRQGVNPDNVVVDLSPVTAARGETAQQRIDEGFGALQVTPSGVKFRIVQ